MTTAESHECLPIPRIEEKELLSVHWLGSPRGSQYQSHEGSCSTAKRNRWGKYPGSQAAEDYEKQPAEVCTATHFKYKGEQGRNDLLGQISQTCTRVDFRITHLYHTLHYKRTYLPLYLKGVYKVQQSRFFKHQFQKHPQCLSGTFTALKLTAVFIWSTPICCTPAATFQILGKRDPV